MRFPNDYRRSLHATNGEEGWFGEQYLQLYDLATVVAVTEAAEAPERLPGYVTFGSDGGGESMAFDLRSRPRRS